MTSLRIVFMGSPDFAVPSLEKLVGQSVHEVVAVVSGTDKKRGRGGALSPTPVKAKALELELPVIHADRLKGNTALEQELAALKPDLFVVVAFKILPDELLAIPRLGSVNVHASLLPKYRGAAPIHHAVMQGETETGCTIFRLDSGIDTGGIIKQVKTPIGHLETTGDVYTRLMQLGSEALLEAVDLLAADKAVFTPQNHAEASPAPKLFDEHCRLDFNQPAKQVHDHIRGLSPFPTAYAQLDGKKLKILRAEPKALPADHPLAQAGIGAVHADASAGTVWVRCGENALALGEVRYEGKRQMPAADFFRGWNGSLQLT
ncbi:methionyl-tRNA formyltransferase [Cyclonatronum proteinivorum]|uniref:Methionyl-tRNA formyltransferase n=1 Tax=Cyclonatronum proteinivorum TaxID=1457365 RepID=A0A345UMY0_9BACT|nr:methionyl-tRNA formyltransferase [Cyclonatronum proteinivorum]AXJ01832.1 methionyl-tRNA formyltransferase [Cyclonatronum proteinivorum]